MSTAESQPSYPTPVRAASIETDRNFPPPPENKESAPFSVLSSLFDRLQGERKPEKRYRLLNSWFNVYLQVASCYALELTYLAALAKRERLQSIPGPEAYLAGRKSVAYPCVLHSSISCSERQRALCIRSQREEPGKSVHKTHSTWIEGPRRSPPPSVETTCRKMGEKTIPSCFLDSNVPQRSTSGDFPSILHEVISKRSSVIKGTLTIDDLNRYLNEITESIGNQEKQSKILQKIYNRATPDEQRWIIRIILKG
jgi:DNA ligase 4